ncbi:hypothetical protein CHS0354_026374 [Potamilus streckersoni]|uniref:Mitochondria-eating protein n=1 Tax=Potamilus streckersoni TaxID=2493646 RepID=A0AAE0T3I1_9BIVA|nr:hypothetical protein CHS0354_026374 [Potamilus streckersoni]
MEKDPSTLNYTLATGSTEVDLNTLMDALVSLQTVDLHGLQGRVNNDEDEQDVSIRLAENVDWKRKYSDLKEQYDTITAQLKTMEHMTSLERKSELVLLQQRIESDEESLKSLKEKLKKYKKELDKKEQRLLTQQKEMEEVQKAKDDALIRLSQQMGQQMLKGNPSITDLSDQNRPSKLGEMYSELYDNEWTNAFKVLTETFHLDEKCAIKPLLKILWESSKHASDVSQSTMMRIENLLAGSSEGEFVQEKLTGLVERTYLGKEKVEIYSKKCFELCWLMSIQDPPIVLSKDPETGAHFDSNLYRCYINSGDNVDYVVWPALLLHKDGPVLAKGVTEPSTSPRAKSASAVERLVASDDKSFDSRSQSLYDKVHESTSGSDGMDKTLYMHQTRYDEKLRESSFGSDRIDITLYQQQAKNYKTQ